jgi:hypothetical protein
VSEQWFAIDLGQPATLARAELAFFADGTRFAAPTAYRLQIRRGETWEDLSTQADEPLANGITHVRWSPTAIRQLRLVVIQPPGRSIRLVEMKVF